jgi:RNA polymerase sigma factor (sigma-70 family)
MVYRNPPSGSMTEAEEAVYRRYAPRIFTYLLRRLPSYQDAEDLLLEVFHIVLEKLPALDQDEQQLGGYIQTIASRRVADYYRKYGTLQRVSLENIEEMSEADDEPNPEQFALAQEEYVLLQRAISALSQRQQEVLRLRYSFGMSIAEIASQISKRESAVRMMLSRALQRLRKFYFLYEKGAE